jgi:hypothetical protein
MTFSLAIEGSSSTDAPLYFSCSIWTSDLTLQAPSLHDQLEFCSIMNALIRMDTDIKTISATSVMHHIAVFARCVNKLCIFRGVHSPDEFQYPPGGVLWRGSSMPNLQKDFFKAGIKYRVPGFLSSTSIEAVAYKFVGKVLSLLILLNCLIRLSLTALSLPSRCMVLVENDFQVSAGGLS